MKTKIFTLVLAVFFLMPSVLRADEVVIMPSGHLRIKADKTVLTKKFEVKLGGSLIVSP